MTRRSLGRALPERLWVVSAFVTPVWFIAALTVDGNGRIFGLSEEPSWVVCIILHALCILINGVLCVVGGRFRLLACLFVVLCLLSIVPAFLP